VPELRLPGVNLILLERHEVDPSGRVTLDDGRGTHLTDVLRVTPDQQVRVGIVDGPIGSARVIATGINGVTLACTFDDAVPERPPVDLLLALPRPKVMRRLWAQLAALGVGRIVLTNAERVERNYFDTHVLEPELFRPLLIEGLQQARDTRVPLVSVHRRFRVLIEDELIALSDAQQRIVADPSAGERLPRVIRPADSGRVLIAIGPEGGWNAFELDLLIAHGFVTVGMGPRTLRADTACIALVALVHEALRSAA
jgi:16S rRNA (uracil1498-N3)-methyltransferase